MGPLVRDLLPEALQSRLNQRSSVPFRSARAARKVVYKPHRKALSNAQPVYGMAACPDKRDEKIAIVSSISVQCSAIINRYLTAKCLSSRFRVVWLLLPFLFMTSGVFADGADGLEQRDIAFYYGSRPPVDDLRHFDQIVIQPSQVLPHEKAALLKLDSLVFAYVSFGEVARNSEDMPRIETKWSIGVNPAWNSLVMNMNDPGWHEYLLEHHFARLWREGYRAFFLDTVDSYLIVTAEGKTRGTGDGTGCVACGGKAPFPRVQAHSQSGIRGVGPLQSICGWHGCGITFHGFDPVTGKHAPTREENQGVAS